VVDLTGVAFMDSTALGTLVGAVRRVREVGGEFRIVLPESPARRIFEITGLEDVLDVHPSRAAALERTAGA
jgi:anti-sigma B factor antagonist